MTRRGRAAAAVRGAISRSRSDLITFGAIFLAVLVLWDTAFVYPLKVLVVLIHEVSHGIAAAATGGRILRIEVNAAQGGVCWTAGGNRFLTLSAGYLGSMAFGAGLLLAAARSRHGDRSLCAALGAFLLGVTLVYIRPFGGFGFVFGTIAGGALLFVAMRLSNATADAVLKVVGTTSCLYAILDIKSDVLDRPGIGSDADMLARHTGVPGVIWGVLWIVLALAVTLWTLSRVAGGRRG